jgi:hypothetical protein
MNKDFTSISLCDRNIQSQAQFFTYLTQNCQLMKYQSFWSKNPYSGAAT